MLVWSNEAKPSRLTGTQRLAAVLYSAESPTVKSNPLVFLLLLFFVYVQPGKGFLRRNHPNQPDLDFFFLPFFGQLPSVRVILCLNLRLEMFQRGDCRKYQCCSRNIDSGTVSPRPSTTSWWVRFPSGQRTSEIVSSFALLGLGWSLASIKQEVGNRLAHWSILSITFVPTHASLPS